ncbi:MAG: threonine--tRNA ligase [Bacilli bacterium]|nr:threonine--tRNA ligase [Bacilli bacterium]
MINIKENERLSIMNHSCAHLMAQAIKHLYKDALFWVGPVIEGGFYYDVDLGNEVLRDTDLVLIEKEMKKISKDGKKIIRKEISLEEAKEMFKNDPYKLDLLSKMNNEETIISCYTQGDFTDLCKGPHVESVKELKYFKLLKVSGAYFKGDSSNKMLQRIYGICFETEEDLNNYLNLIEEAKKCDHRKLGQELDLFMFSETAPGMPYWLPKGLKIYNTLVDFWRYEHENRGYQEFSGPLLNSSSLWKTSGHWDHYKDDMFIFEEGDDNYQALKPMSCPNSILVYKNKIRSYKDLPLRFNDVDAIHRNENSASLHGLLRVRVFHQDDSHNFITHEQIFEEISSILDIATYFYDIFGLKFTPYLSTRPDNYMGDINKWNEAEENLTKILDEKFPNKWILNPGDGAFYGPKIDLKMVDALGREWQTGTIQLDYQLPEKFDLTYISLDGTKKRPVMVHRTIYGSLERFIGILLEHFKGALPFWISPVQLNIIPVNNDYHLDYSKELKELFYEKGFRVLLDERNEKLSYKMRDSQIKKNPITIIIGDKEKENNTISFRVYGSQDTISMQFSNFFDFIKELNTKKSIKIEVGNDFEN